MSPFTVILETREPFGPEVQTMHIEAENAKEAASRALHCWHNGMEFRPTTKIEELEDGTAYVLAVLSGHSERLLRRTPSGKLA